LSGCKDGKENPSAYGSAFAEGCVCGRDIYQVLALLGRLDLIRSKV